MTRAGGSLWPKSTFLAEKFRRPKTPDSVRLRALQHARKADLNSRSAWPVRDSKRATGLSLGGGPRIRPASASPAGSHETSESARRGACPPACGPIALSVSMSNCDRRQRLAGGEVLARLPAALGRVHRGRANRRRVAGLEDLASLSFSHRGTSRSSWERRMYRDRHETLVGEAAYICR